MKKIMIIVLSLILLFLMLPTVAFAEATEDDIVNGNAHFLTLFFC